MLSQLNLNLYLLYYKPPSLLSKDIVIYPYLYGFQGKVGVKTIAKTFASGKSEKLVYQILADNGLPNGKGDSMDKAAFTFEIFYKIYQAICPRTDIEDLFKSLTKIETLAAPKFIEFLNDKQRDGRLNQILYPEYNHKRVMEIINQFEPSEVIMCYGRVDL